LRETGIAVAKIAASAFAERNSSDSAVVAASVWASIGLVLASGPCPLAIWAASGVSAARGSVMNGIRGWLEGIGARHGLPPIEGQ